MKYKNEIKNVKHSYKITS